MVNTMTCPQCNSTLTRNRSTMDNEDHIIRHKLCLRCGYHWKTIEMDADMFCKKDSDEDVEIDSSHGTTPH